MVTSYTNICAETHAVKITHRASQLATNIQTHTHTHDYTHTQTPNTHTHTHTHTHIYTYKYTSFSLYHALESDVSGSQEIGGFIP